MNEHQTEASEQPSVQPDVSSITSPVAQGSRAHQAKSYFAVYLTILVGMLVLDQLTKFWTRSSLVENQVVAVPWPGVLEITLSYNRGIAFGLFQGAGIFLAPIAILIALSSSVFVWRHRHERSVLLVALALLSSGALGNLIDRVFLGKVTDMLWIRAIDFPVFNLADSCITVSALLLLVNWAREVFPGSGKAQLPASEDQAETAHVESV